MSRATANTSIKARLLAGVPVSADARIYLAVGLGSGLGAASRYLCSAGLVMALGAGFPWGTLIVNILGSFIIGFYATLSGPQGCSFPSPAMRQFVLAGFCGGFTTFSIFSLETLLLVQRGSLLFAGANVAASVVLWLIAVWAGHTVAQHVNRRAYRHRRR
jgi:fluoride exporter